VIVWAGVESEEKMLVSVFCAAQNDAHENWQTRSRSRIAAKRQLDDLVITIGRTMNILLPAGE
jgi:hypothetical protein